MDICEKCGGAGSLRVPGGVQTCPECNGMQLVAPKQERYFIGGDNSGHEYYVPVSKRAEFRSWSELPDDDEDGWTEPDYAVRIDGDFTFTDPRCD